MTSSTLHLQGRECAAANDPIHGTDKHVDVCTIFFEASWLTSNPWQVCQMSLLQAVRVSEFGECLFQCEVIRLGHPA